MFRKLIYLSSQACDYSVELPHWSYCSWFDVCWSFGVVGLEWYPCWRLKHDVLQPAYRTKSNTTNVIIQQNSRKLLMMDRLMSETCWAHKKWNKIVTSSWCFILQLFIFCFIGLITLKTKFILNSYPVQNLTHHDPVIDYSATSIFKFKFKHFQKPRFKVCVEK